MRLISYILFVLFSVIVFIAPALFSGYPILTPDSTAYIDCGMDTYMNAVRPIGYSIIIRLFSLKFSLWLVIIGQSVLLSIVLHRFIDLFFAKLGWAFKFLAVLFLAVFTGAGWYTSQIMPDIFGPMAILVLLILINPDVKWFDWLYALPLLGISFIVHQANWLLILVSLLFTGVWFLIKRDRRRIFISLILLAFTVLGYFFHPIANYFFLNQFNRGPYSSHAFVAGRLAETGVMNEILINECGIIDSKYCEYVNNLPPTAEGFLWNDSSPFHKVGGWQSGKAENDKMIKVAFTKFEYLKLYVFKSIITSFRQLVHTDAGRLVWKMGGDPAVQKVIRDHFRHEFNDFSMCIQNQAGIDFSHLNRRYFIVNILSLMTLIGFLYFQKPGLLSEIAIFIMAIVFFNSFIFGFLSAISDRYQGRVIWLLPFFAFSLIFMVISEYIKRRNETHHTNTLL